MRVILAEVYAMLVVLGIPVGGEFAFVLGCSKYCNWHLVHYPFQKMSDTLRGTHPYGHFGTTSANYRMGNVHRPTCDICLKSFSETSKLKRHMQIHTGQFSFYCEICKKGFNERSNYNYHMNRHEGKTFPCSYCNVRYSAESSLKKHLRAVHGK